MTNTPIFWIILGIVAVVGGFFWWRDHQKVKNYGLVAVPLAPDDDRPARQPDTTDQRSTAPAPDGNYSSS